MQYKFEVNLFHNSVAKTIFFMNDAVFFILIFPKIYSILSIKGFINKILFRLHYKEEEIKRINGDWESVSAKEADLSKMQAEVRAKLSDVDSREMSLKFREERLSQEKVRFVECFIMRDIEFSFRVLVNHLNMVMFVLQVLMGKN